MTNELKLISAEVCPFAQRTRLALIEKGLEHELVEVDLRNKPAWFEEISPYSKVPVLLHSEHRVWESNVINEYVEEAFPEPRLTPQTAAGRALMRIWMAFDDQKFVPATYKVLLVTDDREKRQHYAETIVEAFRFMEHEALAKRGGGPWWLGDTLTLADLSIYPHMERLAVLSAYRGIDMPDECVRLRAWLAAMQERPSVRATSHDNAYHVQAYARYADGTADGTTAADMRP